MAPACEKNVQIKLAPQNFLPISFNVVYIEVNETTMMCPGGLQKNIYSFGCK
jgi:hypothetical protein